MLVLLLLQLTVSLVKVRTEVREVVETGGTEEELVQIEEIRVVVASIRVSKTLKISLLAVVVALLLKEVMVLEV